MTTRAATSDPVAAPIAVSIDRAWSDVDVLTLEATARRLGARRVDVEAWLRQLGVVSTTPFGPRVVWGAVVRAMDPATAAPRQPAHRGRVIRLPVGVVPVP